MSRFAPISDEDLDILDGKKDLKPKKNTERVLKRSVDLFRNFLGDNSDFEHFSKNELNKSLRSFFASIRNNDGSEMKKSTLLSVKYGICKYIKDICKIDVCSDSSFSSCLQTFKSKISDLKEKGKGTVEHKEEISSEDLVKLSSNDNLAFDCNTPCGLQRKVWFDIMFFLCLRGQENFRAMTKATFAVSANVVGRRYVYQVVEEADIKHSGDSTTDDTISEGRIYELKGDLNCPVASFEKYITKLHHASDALWQRPLDSFTLNTPIWYSTSPVGKGCLARMMSDISSDAGLSQRYTNHCIRATSISELERNGIETRHLGHKSDTSIPSYSRGLNEDTQQQISDTLARALHKKSNVRMQQEQPVEKASCSGINDFELHTEISCVLNVFNEVVFNEVEKWLFEKRSS